MFGIVRVNNQSVVIDVLVSLAKPREIPTAIFGDLQERIQRVDAIKFVRASNDLVVVLRATRNVAAHFLPGSSAIGTAEETTLATGRFHDGVQDFGIVRRNGHADFSLVHTRQSAGCFIPRLATIYGFVNGCFRATID